jgi:DNA-binding MarR family transcriptional regulator
MTDITSDTASGRRSAAQSALKSPSAQEGPCENVQMDLVACVELFYFAYRDFTCDPDAILEQYGFGRAHHRVLHFVHRNPGLNVAELLDILKITKQSLARVLKQLVDEGFIIQRAGDEDRRERRLYVSAKGARLTDKLTQIQVKRLETALSKAGPGADALTRQFLFGMIAEKDRAHVETLIKQNLPGAIGDSKAGLK